MLTIWLIVASASVSLLNADPEIRAKRMAGGQDSKIKDYPHAISLERRGRHYCGGNIVSLNHILTACHCFDNESKYDLKVRAGSSYREKGGSLHTVETWKCHPKYDGYSIRNDIAVARVKEKFKLDDTRQIIQLFNDSESLMPDDNATVAGWGYVNYDRYEIELAEQLQAMDMRIVNTSVCSDMYTPYIKLSPGQICAEKDYASGTCRGDSGGGLIVQDSLVGLLSFSANDCDYHFLPAVFTEVAYFRNWVLKRIDTMGPAAERGLLGWICNYIWCPRFLES